ncbi:MAG: hypothetical protein KBS85_03865, partial [Lachnospiraceae bacterium]|nr:hypothetical protein [Candidatus Merdinaster equi]
MNMDLNSYNIFFEGVSSVHGFQSRIINKVEEQLNVDTWIITYKGELSEEAFGDNCTLIDYDICEHNRYEEYYDMNDFLPLERDLLEKMLPYESTALQMLVRNYERHIYTVDECKHFYLNHLRFWNHQIVTRKINYICFSNIPHHCHDYVIYALGKVYGIPMSFCSDTSIPPRLATCTDMENMWKDTYEKYLEYRELPAGELSLPEDLEHYYKALLYKNKGLDDSAVHRGWSKEHHIAVRREFFMHDFQTKNIINRHFKWYKHGLKVKLSSGDSDVLKKAKKRIHEDNVFVKRGRIKLKSMRGTKYYDSLAYEPDYEKDDHKYVIFFLHLQPEATTLPKGGVFVEQELMLQILANALEKCGLKLYVKEHFVQPYRNKTFYDQIAGIRNVKLIKTDIESRELIQHAFATASCNGTVLLESMFNGIPTFIFGDTPFRNGPGVYYIGSVGETIEAIEHIQNGEFVYNEKDVIAELKAFGESSFRGYFNSSEYEKQGKISEDEGVKSFAEYVVENV